jgi:hypothetical protein
MEPIDLLTADATIDVDGVELDPEEYPPPTVFGSNSNGMSMLVTTTLEGDLDTVFEINAEGTTTAQMQTISPGCMVSITPEMMDEEKLREFTFAEAIVVPDFLGDLSTRKLESPPVDSTTARELQEFSPCGALRVIEVTFGADSSFCSKAGGRSKTITKIGQMVALANQKYKVPGICARIRIKFCDIQCNASTDRYSSEIALAKREVSCDAFINFVINLWYNNAYLKARRGDTTHLFSGTHVAPLRADGNRAGGCAFPKQLCSDYSFGVNNIYFSTDLALQANTFAHELAHNAGM